MAKKYCPVNLDVKTHAELLKRRKEGKGAISRQIMELVFPPQKDAPIAQPAAQEAQPVGEEARV